MTLHPQGPFCQVTCQTSHSSFTHGNDDTERMRHYCVSHPVTVRLQGDVWECRNTLDRGVCGQLLKENYLLDEIVSSGHEVVNDAGGGTQGDSPQGQVSKTQA